MPRFADTLAAYQGLGTELPDTWGDDLTGAYNDDLAEVSAVQASADAKVQELTEALAAAQSELTATKAQNYDLLMQVAAQGGSEDEGSDADSEDEGSDDEDKDPVEDLFE